MCLLKTRVYNVFKPKALELFLISVTYIYVWYEMVCVCVCVCDNSLPNESLSFKEVLI